MSRSCFAYCSVATLIGGLLAGLLSLGPLAVGWHLRLPTVAMAFVLIGWPVNLCLLRCFSGKLPAAAPQQSTDRRKNPETP